LDLNPRFPLAILILACKNELAHDKRQSGRKSAAQSQRIPIDRKISSMWIARLPKKAKPAKAGDAKPLALKSFAESDHERPAVEKQSLRKRATQSHGPKSAPKGEDGCQAAECAKTSFR
jgi:hypothetical protein